MIDNEIMNMDAHMLIEIVLWKLVDMILCHHDDRQRTYKYGWQNKQTKIHHTTFVIHYSLKI